MGYKRGIYLTGTIRQTIFEVYIPSAIPVDDVSTMLRNVG